MQLPIEFAIRAVLIAAATASVLGVLKVKTAAARHAAWTGVLAVMLLLPLWTAWGPKLAVRLLPPLPEQNTINAIETTDLFQPAMVSPGIARPQVSTPAPRTRAWSWTACLLGIYLVGLGLLLVRLGVGTLQAHLLVRRARRRDCQLFSASCGAPVTIGWFHPVVVLPENYFQWPSTQLDAVLTHEHEHVRRRDPLVQWLAALNRAIFWFHPLAWWLERRLSALAEEACDAAVIKRGHDAHAYSKYLIDIARSLASSGVRVRAWGMAMPGAYLEERIRRILEGGPLAPLSRARLVCTSIACVATSTLLATSTLDHQFPTRQPDQNVLAPTNKSNVTVAGKAVPMLAKAQQQGTTGLPTAVVISDGPGVKVIGAEHVMHRTALEYPAEARANGIEGTVILDVVLAADGTVSDAAVISGPEELRKAALSSVLGWHFQREAAPRQQVSVEFKAGRVEAPATAPAAATPPPPMPPPPPARQAIDVELEAAKDGVKVVKVVPVVPQGVVGGVIGGGDTSIDFPHDLKQPEILKRIMIGGLPPERTAELRSRLPIQEGQLLDSQMLQKAQQIIQEFDPTLKVSLGSISTVGDHGPIASGVALMIVPAGPSTPSNVPRKVMGVRIQGLSPEAEAELRRRLAIPEGEVLSSDAFRELSKRVEDTAREFDSHLRLGALAAARRVSEGPPDVMNMTFLITPHGYTPPPQLPSPPPGVQRIQVGGGVQAQKLKNHPEAVYPPLAKQARLSGVVRLNALIGADGKIISLTVVAGHPLLVNAAMEAAKQYEYEPTLLNGKPAQVATQVDVNFTLPE